MNSEQDIAEHQQEQVDNNDDSPSYENVYDDDNDVGTDHGDSLNDQHQDRPSADIDSNDIKLEPENYANHDIQPVPLSKPSLRQRTVPSSNRTSPPGSILNKKIKQLSASHLPPQNPTQQSSLQSLMQATGMEFGSNNGTRSSPMTKRKKQDLSTNQKNFNQTTSSLFSILAGLTQKTALNPSQQQTNPTLRSTKPAHVPNTLNLSQGSRNGNNNYITNPPFNSSLLTLLNEKISGNVASSLQTQLKKNLEPSIKIQSSNTRSDLPTNTNNGGPYYQASLTGNDSSNYNSGTMINNLGMSNGDSRQLNSESCLSSLNPFIESIAKKTGSNIGPAGIAEAKKILDKFTTWLMYSSQTIADHYIAPYAADMPQQKPEISASDVILAYKMMQKSQPQ